MNCLKFLSALALLSMTGAAKTETLLAEYPKQIIIIPPRPASTAQLRQGDVLLSAPLHWQLGATLPIDVEIRAEELATIVKAGAVLPLTRLMFDSPAFARAVTICTPRDANVLATNMSGALFGSLGLKLIKSGNDTQYCLIDQDADGRADHSVAINDGSPAARLPKPIEPVAYSLQEVPEIGPDHKLQIIYLGKERFELSILLGGEQLVFTELETSSGNRPIRAHRFLPGEKQPDGSKRFKALGIPFVATYDKAAKTMRIDWQATDEAIVAPIPDTVKYQYRYGY